MENYAAFSCPPLETGITFVHPPKLPELVRLDSPALDVMTDFRYTQPITVDKSVPIDDALEKMKLSGVRLLLVVEDDETIIGSITSKIILGEDPIRIVEKKRIPRAEITVGMVMVPQNEVTVISLVNVRNAKVGHIVATLRRLDRKHLLVIDTDKTTGKKSICGLFSTSQIGRQLGVLVVPAMPAAQTLAEIKQKLER
uniref:CBS domain-containing protein n=1 Tax=Candidatus Kentrum sp. TUN TaxID=2126343 RepID=A0A450ZM89_9GAMM|nr:MAG: CBS domain-containing protein [Candidatus Kentron sp. TUN]VFK57691.1 MAG: CBS domain-containing protein [Candidatus Kentron sp. TUN]VFK66472.1 MAG: CBS domain-containing protein [Candidatus Kentron sp. TUN]